MSVVRFLDFMAKLNDMELAAVAGVRGSQIAGLPTLVEKIRWFEEQNGFEFTTQEGTLKPFYHRIVADAVIYDEATGRVRFDREAGKKVSIIDKNKQTIDNTPLRT